MNYKFTKAYGLPCVAAFILTGFVGVSAAQQTYGELKGQVTDASGAVVPGVGLTLVGSRRSATASTDGTGEYVFAGLTPGRYKLRASATGFAVYENNSVDIAAGHMTTLRIRLVVALEKQEVTVTGAAPGPSTAADANASAIVLRGEELDALPDDPDELAGALKILAGPAAGPSGGEIYIDGFSGVRLPPKSSIREVRLNQNPLSAEYDRFGMGRIEILTKPGAEKLRGESFFEFGDSALNSRNPFSSVRAPFQQRLYGGDVSGPLGHKASFFVDLERREVDDDALVHATTLDPLSLYPVAITQFVKTPDRWTSVSPRVDYQLNQNHTVTARYRFTATSQENAGAGGLALASRAYGTSLEEQVAQVADTALLSARAVNETRFQFVRLSSGQESGSALPAVFVLGAFTGGGAQLGRASNVQDRYELQNYSTVLTGAHSLTRRSRNQTGLAMISEWALNS